MKDLFMTATFQHFIVYIKICRMKKFSCIRDYQEYISGRSTELDGEVSNLHDESGHVLVQAQQH